MLLPPVGSGSRESLLTVTPLHSTSALPTITPLCGTNRPSPLNSRAIRQGKCCFASCFSAQSKKVRTRLTSALVTNHSNNGSQLTRKPFATSAFILPKHGDQLPVASETSPCSQPAS